MARSVHFSVAIDIGRHTRAPQPPAWRPMPLRRGATRQWKFDSGESVPRPIADPSDTGK